MKQRSARAVHRALQEALARLYAAEKSAVLLFGEVMERKLYRALGHSSIQAYAAAELGFTAGKTREFIRLAESLKTLPRVKQALGEGEIGWTKARTVARVASPETEQAWLREARENSSRELEARVRASRQRPRDGGADLFAVAAGQVAANHTAISGVARDNAAARNNSALAPAGAAESAPGTRASSPPPPAKAQVSFSLSAEMKAKLEACLETLRKRGDRRSREDLLLAAFELLVAAGASRDAGASASRDRGPDEVAGESAAAAAGEAASRDRWVSR